MKDFFSVTYKDKNTKARLGIAKTVHGEIETPVFVPVSTQASMKSLSSQEILDTQTQLTFVNTYHLYLRPGTEVIKKFNGVHNFMNYQGPLISDSGGFQIFSLGLGLEHGVGKIANIFPEENARNVQTPTKKSLVKIDDEGATFQSHIDGTTHRFTPEKSIQIQETLGTDIALAFDECTSPLSSKEYVALALERTHRWAHQCLKAHTKKDQALFGIVQGGHFSDLRELACMFMSNQPFDGYAIGGDFGKSKKEMVTITDYVMDHLPEEKYRHVLGIGEIDDIFAIVENGADSFDCVMPTRLGRMGHILSMPNNKLPMSNGRKKFTYDVTKAKYQFDKKPLEEGCKCWVCQTYSRAYIHHLFRSRELLSYRLATYHNVYFLNNLVQRMRHAIKRGTLLDLKKTWLN